jgi:predicted Fe-Mo cluster-binding NifX family protein
MKIAVVTEDERTISRHFGRAPYFIVCTVENGHITGRARFEKVAHHHGHGHDHAHDHDHSPQVIMPGVPAAPQPDSHAAMLEPIRGCDVLLTRGMGRGAHIALTRAGIRPILTDIAAIDEAVQAVIDGTIIDHPEKLH